MKRLFLFACLLYTIPGCNTFSGSPKESLNKFITAMTKSDYEEAKKYATDDSQSFLNMIENSGKGAQNIYSDKTFDITNVEINGSEAKVEVKFSSSTPAYFRLTNEHGAWKVHFNLSALMDMVKDIIKKEGSDVDKDLNHALDSIKVNIDSLP